MTEPNEDLALDAYLRAAQVAGDYHDHSHPPGASTDTVLHRAASALRDGTAPADPAAAAAGVSRVLEEVDHACTLGEPLPPRVREAATALAHLVLGPDGQAATGAQ